MKFAGLNCLATILCLTIFATTIAALTVDWFSYSSDVKFRVGGVDTVLNSTKLLWSLEGLTSRTVVNSGSEVVSYTPHKSETSVWSIMKLVETFVLIALLVSGIVAVFLTLCFACTLRNKLLFLLGMNVLRISLVLVSVVILGSLLIALLGFLGLNNAATNDIPNCTAGFCKRLSDNTFEVLTPGVTMNGATGDIVQARVWGPIAGVFLILACIPLSIVVLLIVIVNKFPIPVDSVTIGEAL